MLIILSLSAIPNIVLAVLIILKPPTHSSYYYKFSRGNVPVIEIHTRIETTSNYTFIGLAATYAAVILTLVLYIGIHNRKIKMKNLNTTGQVYLLLAVLVITIGLAISIVIIFLVLSQNCQNNVPSLIIGVADEIDKTGEVCRT